MKKKHKKTQKKMPDVLNVGISSVSLKTLLT
jgi:hypothetical protein